MSQVPEPPMPNRSIRLPPKLWRQLEIAAAREQRTAAAMARVILTEAVGHIQTQEEEIP